MAYLTDPRNPAPPTTLTSRLLMLLEVSPRAKAIVLRPAQLSQLKKECAPLFRHYPYDDGEMNTFCGVPIRRRSLSLFCCNCGAPSEPKVCSYCRTANDEITIEE